jgi:hypothetical protein
MQAIITKYHGPTETERGARISARCFGGRTTVPVAYDKSDIEKHWVAAKAPCQQLGWKGKLVAGRLQAGTGYSYAPRPVVPTMPDYPTMRLREDLIIEEFREFTQANTARDIVAAADAIADMAYVVIGAAIAYGINLEPVFDEVHRSNMSKVWTKTEIQQHNESAPLSFISSGVNRYIAKRADGKVVKSPSYSRADVAREIEKQRTITGVKCESQSKPPKKNSKKSSKGEQSSSRRISER